MNVLDNVIWAGGEIADHPGRLGLITAIGVVVAMVIMLQNTVMPWERTAPGSPTINNTTIIREPGQPDRVVVHTNDPRPAVPGPAETARRHPRSAAPSPTWTRASNAPEPRPRPVPDVTPAPRPSATSPRPTEAPGSSAPVTPEPTTAPTVDPTPDHPVTSPEGTTS